MFIDQDEVKVHKLTKKKTVRPISSHLDQTSVVNKGFIIWLLARFFLWVTAGTEWARQLHHSVISNNRLMSVFHVSPVVDNEFRLVYQSSLWIHSAIAS